jgi:hypothetical protein
MPIVAIPSDPLPSSVVLGDDFFALIALRENIRQVIRVLASADTFHRIVQADSEKYGRGLFGKEVLRRITSALAKGTFRRRSAGRGLRPSRHCFFSPRSFEKASTGCCEEKGTSQTERGPVRPQRTGDEQRLRHGAPPNRHFCVGQFTGIPVLQSTQS